MECTENRFLYYAGSVLYHAECISICCAEYRCRKEKPGMEGFLHCNHYRMFCWNHHLYGRILRRRSISSFFTNDSEVIAAECRLPERFLCRLYTDLCTFQQYRYFNGCGKSIPVMIQGITSAFCIRIPVSIIMSSYRKHL